MRSICLVLALGLALVGLCVGQSVLKTTEWGFEQDVRLVDEERVIFYLLTSGALQTKLCVHRQSPGHPRDMGV